MKYRTNKIIEDADLLEGVNLTRLSEVLGYSVSYLSRIKNNLRIVPEDTYLKIKTAVDQQEQVLDNSGNTG